MSVIILEDTVGTKWLQSRLFNLDKENYKRLSEEILLSVHILSKESVINLAHNIIIATQSRCLQLPFYAELVILLLEKENEHENLKFLLPELIEFCFIHSSLKKGFQPFLVFNFYMYNQFYFIYLLTSKKECINQSNENDRSILNNFAKVIFYEEYLKNGKTLPFEIIQMFLPEIEKNDPNFFQIIMKKRGRPSSSMSNSKNSSISSTNISSAYNLIKNIVDIRDNFFCNSLILQSLQNDDIDTFQELSNSINISEKIELWKYYPFRFRDSTFPINIAAFFGSLKIFKFLMLNIKNEYEVFNNNLLKDAVIGGNIEIIRLIVQKRENQEIDEELVKYAIAAHRNDIVQWLIENNNIKIENLIETCLDSNNIEILDSVLYFLDEGKKAAVFESERNRINICNSAKYGYFDLIKYLFDYEIVNSWKKDQKVYFKVLLKVANHGCIQLVDYLINNNFETFDAYKVNCTYLLTAAAKSGDQEMFSYAKNLYKNQKIRPSTNKDILGKAIIGGNLDIFQKCMKLYPHNIDQLYKRQISLLTLSIIKNRADIFDYLLTLPEIYENVNLCFRGKQTSLCVALEFRRIEMVNKLLSIPNIDVNLGSPIMDAIKFGFSDVVERMCTQFENIEVNFVLSDGTPLLYAIEKKDIISFRALLSIKNVDINFKPSRSNPPIYAAIISCVDNDEFMRLLLGRDEIILDDDEPGFVNIMEAAVVAGNAKAIIEMEKRNFPFLSQCPTSGNIPLEAYEAVCKCKGFTPKYFTDDHLYNFIRQDYFDLAKHCLSFEDEVEVNHENPILEALNKGNEEIAIMIAKNHNFRCNKDVLIKAIKLNFDKCIETILTCHEDFIFDASYQKGKPLYVAAEFGTKKTIEIIIRKCKSSIRIDKIKEKKISPEKDAQFLEVFNSIE